MLKSWKKWEAVPENREAFDAVERVWHVAEAVPELPVATPEELADDDYDGSVPISLWRSARAAEARAAASRAAGGGSGRAARRTAGSVVWHQRRVVRRTFGLAAAAAVAVIALLTVQHLHPFIQTFWGNQPDRTVVVETGLGEHRQIVFEDGTRIQLGAQTSITANFTKTTRSVALDHGEAHFNVAKDPKRPFEVSAAGGTITAVGTSFNVQHRQDSDVVVTVTEGIVEVAPPASVSQARDEEEEQGDDEEDQWRGGGPSTDARPATQRIVRGQEITFDGQGKMSPVRLAEVDTSLAWRNGRFKYTNEPLRHVIEDINRYSRRQLILDDSVVGDLLYSGTVFASDIEEWVAGLEQTFPQIEVVANDEARVLLRTRVAAKTTRP